MIVMNSDLKTVFADDEHSRTFFRKRIDNVDKTDWFIQWSSPLLPDLEWIPGDEIFLQRIEECSLSTDFDVAAGSLFVSPDTLPRSVKKTRKRGKQKDARRRKTKGSV